MIDQVGRFVGDAWKEWNGIFRDDVRDFFRTTPGSLRRVADRLVGSPEVFGHEEREAEQSINFVTCHDGFTLNDRRTQGGNSNSFSHAGPSLKRAPPGSRRFSLVARPLPPWQRSAA